MTGTRLLKLEVLALIIMGPKYFPGGGGGCSLYSDDREDRIF